MYHLFDSRTPFFAIHLRELAFTMACRWFPGRIAQADQVSVAGADYEINEAVLVLVSWCEYMRMKVAMQ